jgi:Na+-transporting NADH:ubiquinone oxidoreductase subunit D
MKLIKTKAFKTFKNSVWENNPVSIQSLGICSALAVTVQLKTAVVMGISLTVVIAVSSMIISLIRNIIPRNIRIIVEISIIATLVILTDEFLRAFYYDISKQLSIFVGLIITNCIVLGRTEAFALSNPPHLAFIDGVGNGAGYGAVLTAVAFIRELLGSGKIFGIKIFPDFFYHAGYDDMGFMLLAPSAFIIIGLMVWLQKTLIKENNK